MFCLAIRLFNYSVAMKKSITVFMTGVFLCFYQHGTCQVYDFSDGRIPDNWYGQKDYFEVNQAHQLHLLAPTGSTAACVSWK